MDILEIMKARHSVRQYTDKSIETEKRAALIEAVEAINKENGLHIQVIFDEPKCFNSMMAHYGKFSGVKNYICLVGRKGDNLEEKCGYYGERLVLKAQELGLNTCWVAMTHGKSAARIDKGEKQTCIISLGYGVSQGVKHKSKPMNEVADVDGDMPEWFRAGMEAVLLAPTAVNQQKFLFSLKKGEVSAKVSSFGFYAKTDLGIAKYHFEAVTGKKVR